MGARTFGWLAVAFVLAGATGAIAGADTEPVIVVPGRPGVPIIIDGQDVRGAIIEGEWGLARGHTGLTIIRPRSLIYQGAGGRSSFERDSPNGPVGHFYPGTGLQPRMGREEVIPPANRPLPPKAESFQRNWKVESQPLPANNELQPFPMPPVGVGVDVDGRRDRRGR
jgi:hypothetical protein